MRRTEYSRDIARLYRERYFNTLKVEEIYQYRYNTVEVLDYAINHFAYVWYNQIRPHSRNGYLTPSDKRFGLK